MNASFKSGEKLWAAAALVSGVEVLLATRNKEDLAMALLELRCGCSRALFKRVKVQEVQEKEVEA